MIAIINFLLGFFFGWLLTVKKTWVLDIRDKMEKDINKNIIEK